MSDKDQIRGSVERVTYYSAQNGYTVLRLKPDNRNMLPFKYASGRDALITVVGNLPEVSPGEWLKLSGSWSTHAKHGRQFQAEQCEKSIPASSEGIKRYLGSGLIQGIGPVTAERIVDHFGTDTLNVIELEPGRLAEVPGIGKKRVTGIIKAWEDQRAIKDVMIFLQSHGVTINLATKIYKKYGDSSLAVVQNTPYRLVQDIYGVGFKTADGIARATGIAADDPGRIEAGIAYTLNKMADEGHVYAPQELLEPEASKILGVEVEKVAAVIDRLESSDVIKREIISRQVEEPAAEDDPTVVKLHEERAVYLTNMYYSEVGVSNRIQRLIDHPTSRLAPLQAALSTHRLEEIKSQIRSSVPLAPQQAQALSTAIYHKVTVLTGGPGTGKTTTLRALLDLLDSGGHSYALASPTGRAAKRLAEATGRQAKTIHRLLGFSPGTGFDRNEDQPLDVDMVVIDEASMLDLMLANGLLKAIGPDTHLLLVGDTDQLPSVGAGDVLGDLIESGAAAVVRLQTIFRQAAGSMIIRNAHHINQGRMLETDPKSSDFYVFIKQEPEETADLLIDIVHRRIPHKFQLDPFDDIQVLSPMYNGQVGVHMLNQKLQLTLNPSAAGKAERKLGGRTFRVGDKVMQTVNNYDKNVYNGDIGRIVAIDGDQQTVNVNIDGTPVTYDFLESDELIHAYAISVHKSQGAEYPCVVMPVLMQHYMMLQRNLLYTAITRAKRLVILVGTRHAINTAIKNDKIAQRHTALDWRLKR